MREPMRRAACEAAVDLFLEDDSVAIVLAEISVDLFEPAFAHAPERAINVGIMEQTMVGVAAGFALEGFRPVVHTIAPFLTERAHEQIKLDFGYQRLEGLFVTTGASYDYSTSGMTHHCPGDVAALSTVPGMRVLVPGAPAEAIALVRGWHARGGLSYVRTSSAVNAESREVAEGGLTLIRRGRDATVIAVGPVLDRVLAAIEGFDVTVLYATTVYPLDGKTLRQHAAPSPDVVLVEPMYEGTTTAQVAGAFEDRPVRLLSVGVPRQVIEGYGTVAELDRNVGLSVDTLAKRIGGFLRIRRPGSDEVVGGGSSGSC
jgi:transketolase